jgi:hypothetical protein
MAKRTDDTIKSRGVGLKQSEWEEVEKIAYDLGIKPYALAAYAIRYFLKAWHEGKIKTETRKTQTLPDL